MGILVDVSMNMGEHMGEGESGEKPVPDDFAEEGSAFSLAGAQPKLAVVKVGDAFYPTGATPAERRAAYDMCEDLAHQLVPYCQRKLDEGFGTRDAVLKAVRASIVRKGWCTSAQADWVIRRTGLLLSWIPANDFAPAEPLRAMVLFLDFDGVLHADGSVDDQCFAPSSTLLLRDVLQEHPNVDVVVSSSWREVYSLDQLRSFLPAELGRRIIDCTPSRVERIHLPGELWSFARHGQCWAWMAWNRPDGTPWLALDDDAWRFAPDCGELVLVDGRNGFSAREAAELDRRIRTLGMEKQV